MRRTVIISLILFLLAFRSFATGRSPNFLVLPVPNLSYQSPVSVSRSKKPFPFHCVQLLKKRLANPPSLQQESEYRDSSEKPVISDAFEHLYIVFLVDLDTVKFPPLTPKRYLDNNQSSIFHPPPFIA